MKHSEALNIAKPLYDKLKEVSSVIFVAGSLRRLKADVGDIEIVASIPMEKRTAMYKILEQSCTHVKGMGKGRNMQWQDKRTGIIIDLFLPVENDFYRVLAIRTGSAEYTKRLIAGGWVKKGWVGTDEGLRLRTECAKKGNKWICIVQNPTLPPVWKSEKEFFQWLDVRWTEPKERGL